MIQSKRTPDGTSRGSRLARNPARNTWKVAQNLVKSGLYRQASEAERQAVSSDSINTSVASLPGSSLRTAWPPKPKAAGSSPAGDITSWRPRTYNSSQGVSPYLNWIERRLDWPTLYLPAHSLRPSAAGCRFWPPSFDPTPSGPIPLPGGRNPRQGRSSHSPRVGVHLRLRWPTLTVIGGEHRARRRNPAGQQPVDDQGNPRSA